LGSWWLSGRSLGPAQRAWDQQHAFIANASHELRTPLTLIQATTEIGLRARPEEEQAEVLQDILDETGYMNQLVDDLLLLSRLDTRRLQLKRQVINLAELLQDVYNLAEKIAQPRQVAVQLGSTAGSIWGDPVRMRQVLLILIDNAIRFSPPGSAIRLETQAQGKYWNILVIDHGRGIPAKDLPHLFERFYQVQQSGDDMSRNSGLGLSIAKGLVEAQGGTIRLESQPDQGTRATLILPSA
jgi:signal transduction histidine kinase